LGHLYNEGLFMIFDFIQSKYNKPHQTLENDIEFATVAAIQLYCYLTKY